MVWRFLITFADVLKLWPFTLDEFVQAFHDYDSRLLGEIHVALLKLIIKDIEDVARTPSTGLVVNQNSAANPGGGHPQTVKGAYAWGFDIRNWQQHLNPLTWPEIFWQLALFAGFRPQLKKRSIRWSYSHENDEANRWSKEGDIGCDGGYGGYDAVVGGLMKEIDGVRQIGGLRKEISDEMGKTEDWESQSIVKGNGKGRCDAVVGVLKKVDD
uniref:DDT domain-containing protein n=1 Tax=Quercus lobata TaxID=97700 RepID=A0A7N2MVI1_QUELO